ncbi:MAG: PDZ domain-containing protein [Acidobacteria bacterium]|nr:PDZ domain-containing protein [Acidobacteriota bacterium]
MFRTTTLLAACFWISVAVLAQQGSDRPLLIGRVAINPTHVAFTYAGKIWLVERTGGTARRLTSTPNEETSPVFSPDGRRIAFSQSNGNDWDVFIAPADGSGQPTRVTMMPEDDFVTGWSPDGKEVIFETTRDEESVTRLYKTSADRLALATPLPLHQSYSGSISPDATRIVYNPRSGAGDWRYYRGGYAAPLWIANLKTGALEKLSNGTHNDRNPQWIEDRIFFVSDRTGIFNLYAYDTKSKKTQQLTQYMGQGVRTASATNGAAVYVQGGRLHLLDLNTNKDQVLSVSVAPDTSELATRNVGAARFLEQILPSATGDRMAFGVRGEVIVFDPANGSYKNLTNTPGVAERYPVISPDNKSVAYVSDESGEYALHVRSLENDAVKKIRIEEKPSYYWDLAWSPDSRILTFPDRRLGFWLADVTSGTALRVDTSTYSAEESWRPGFSPDSRFLAYSRRMKNRAGAVFIYDIAQKKSFQITDGVSHTERPVFDRNGKYLYFVSSPNVGTTEFSWGVLNGVFANPLVVRRVHAMVLSKDQPSPLLPNGQPNPDAKVSEIVPQVKIDFEGLRSRVVNLPLPPRDYAQLAVGQPGKLVLAVRDWTGDPGGPTGQSVHSFDVAKGGQMQKIVDQINGVDITADGKKILYRKGRDFFLVSTEAAAKSDEGRQDFSKVEVRVVPAEEWRQMFHESMRIMRDWFYDPNHHGQNLAALESEFAAYLPTTVRRSDLNRLMQQMLGSVSVSHLGIGGGDAPPPGSGGNRIGLLGADYEVINAKYRFKKIYRSMTYSSPAGSFGAPLDQPGVDVREGDYLLQVNDKPVEAEKNVLSYFENTIGRPTKVTVSANADGANARTYTVFPAGGENRLRRANWAEENRKRVEQLSGGKLGYIFIEGYGGEGIMNAVRGLTGYGDKQGVIIDQRFNGGGITPDYLIEWMQRRPLYYYMFRGGDDIATPVNPAPPVKVMIVNELNGSAAETGAFMFKLGKVGPIVGKRTFGGGIGPYYFTPRLIDGGQIQLPNRAAYDPSGTSWGVENVGVAPDFDVEITPADVIAGRDPQLEKAVEVALAQISKTPVIVPKRPPFPVHPGEQNKTQLEVSMSSLPQPGSAFPAPATKSAQTPPATPVTDAKFAAFVGRYDGGTMGVLVITQEGEKLLAIDPGGGRVELVPEATPDKFTATSVGGGVTFERDAAGKVTGITVTLPDGRTIKARKV